MKNDYLYAQYTRSYFSLRKAVGIIGMALPFVLMLGNYLLSRGRSLCPPSASITTVRCGA